MMDIFITGKNNDQPAPPPAASFDRHGKPKADPAFDGWLRHHLCQLYDPVVHEPIPADLLALLEERLK